MASKEKLLKLRHDFYTNEKVNYDSISYFTSIEKDLEVLEVLEKHPLLDLSKLYDYDDANEYIEDYDGTTDELEINEFKILKEWQEKAQNT